MSRPHRSVVFVCVVVVALAAFLPGVSVVDAIFEPTWILLPDLAATAVPDTTPETGEQPRSLLSVLPSRAPPAPAFA